MAPTDLRRYQYAGLRREVLVLHALRPSGAAGEDSAIDAVARWLLSSQHVTHGQGAGLAPVTDSRLQSLTTAAEAASANGAATQPQVPPQPGTAAATLRSEPALPADAHDAAVNEGISAPAGSTQPAQPPPPSFPDATTAFTAAAQRHADGIGIVHLAMHVHDGGLVTAWDQRVESVTEPGATLLQMPNLTRLPWSVRVGLSRVHCNPWAGCRPARAGKSSMKCPTSLTSRCAQVRRSPAWRLFCR